MKRAWIAGSVLILLLAVSWWNAWYIQSFTQTLSGVLAQAEDAAETGDWEMAGRLTMEAQDRWEGASRYLYTVLRHADTDQVDIKFQAVLEWIECREDGEYSSANAELMAQLALIAGMEQPSIKNLL
ncbi:MAG: DUF4363 family protein [Oscillospiraceae bacterium]|nr:DUF4363 family protein [Oscillospiraceae bacterium]